MFANPPSSKAIHWLKFLANVGLCAMCLEAHAAPASFSEAVHQGTNSNLHLTASFTPDSAHAGQDLHVFALAWVPGSLTSQGPTGKWFARSSQGWVALSEGQTWPVAMTVRGSSTQALSIPLLAQDDIRTVMGTQVYLGYGVSGVDASLAIAEMLANKRYNVVYTVNQSPSDTGRAENERGLTPTSERELQALFAQAQRSDGEQSGGIFGNITAGGMPVPVAAPGSSTGAMDVANVSGTTLQEAGVDEDDLVKSDGLHLYNLSSTPTMTERHTRNVLQRHRPGTGTSSTPASESLTLPWSQGLVGSGLFLDTANQQAIVLAQGGLDYRIHDLWFYPGRYWGAGVTELALIDTGRDWRVKRHVRFSGALIGSRRIGSTLYVLLRSYPNWPMPASAVDLNATKSDNTVRAQALPTVQVDQGTIQALVQAVDCLIPRRTTDNLPSVDTITLVALDLASPQHKHTARCFIGSTEAFYVSEQNVYLATTRQAYTLSGRFPVYPSQIETDIHQFALNGLEMNYQGSGSVPGHLGFDQNRKSFRMGEHNGVLRVFTQTGQQFGGWVGLPMATTVATSSTASVAPLAATTPDSPGRMTLLQPRNGVLETIGELPNPRRPAPLGKPGEQLYASRFIGNRGYLVTYRLIDPLYVIDLTEPTDPKVLGELEVSGYSDYLFPVSEQLLLGVGKEAVADGSVGDGRAAWYQGVKVSLIDLSDPAHPKEHAKTVIGKRGTDATALQNHHGIALQKRSGSVRVALPVSLRDTPTAYTTGRANDYFGFTQNELHKFEVDLNASTMTQKPPAFADKVERSIADDRAVIWNDQVHHFTGEQWLSAPW